jgi:hypothetical protein
MTTYKTENVARQERQTYSKPELRVFGLLSEITRGANATSTPDGGNLPHDNTKATAQEPA